MEIRLARVAIVAFALFLMSRTFAHYIEGGPARGIPAVVLATAVVVLYVLAGGAHPDRGRGKWVVVMALLVYLPLPFLGEWWAAAGIFLAAAALGLLPRPYSLPVFALVVLAEALKSIAFGDGPTEVMSWTLTVAVAAVLLAGLTHFAQTARVLYETRAELAVAEVAAQRARAMGELEGVLGSRLEAIAAQGRKVMTVADGEAGGLREELRHMLDLAREAQSRMREFAHREQRIPSGKTGYPK